MEYIKLQSAHATQISSEKNGKGAWKIRENITSKDLFELPGHISEKDIFTILDFAKKFELEAFNAGIQFGKNINKTNLQIARNENNRLSSILEKQTRRR